MAAVAAARSAFRSSSTRSVAAKIASKTQSVPSFFRFPKPIAAPRILRSPVEVSFCVESLMPMHSVTAAALMTSMLSVARTGYGLLAEGLVAWVIFVNQIYAAFSGTFEYIKMKNTNIDDAAHA